MIALLYELQSKLLTRVKRSVEYSLKRYKKLIQSSEITNTSIFLKKNFHRQIHHSSMVEIYLL